MDKRGLTVDPNRDVFADLKWYDTLGQTQKPSPYATASWQYFHTFEKITELDPNGVLTDLLFDGGDNFAQNAYQTILDAGVNFPNPGASLEYYENGLYGDLLTGLVDDDPTLRESITRYFASVKVFDEAASAPESQTVFDILAIDAFFDSVVILEPIDPNDLSIFDNGDLITDPVPNPGSVYDGGTFAQIGQGIDLDEALFVFSNNPALFRVQEITADADDGLPLLAEDGEELEIGTYLLDEEPRGTLLGEINYEITGPLLNITDWSHYNWHNSKPVEKAFSVLLAEAPECVDLITVKNAPTAFWRKLGFRQAEKGAKTLIYDKNSQYVTKY